MHHTYAMHRCPCHLKALELIVSDLAGLHLRQQRAQHVLRQNHRQFSTRPSLRQVESAKVANSDNVFIPFDFKEGKSTEFGSTVIRTTDAAAKDESLEKDDWHAELEIVAQTATRVAPLLDATQEEESILSDDAGYIKTSNDMRTVDAVSLEALHPSRPTDVSDPRPPILPQKRIPAPPKSRAESRKERKSRRVEAGTYKPSAVATGDVQQTEPTQMQTVLAKLDELEDKDTPTRAAPRQPKAAEPQAANASPPSQERQKIEKTPTPDRPPPRAKQESWGVQKSALENKFGEAGWQPRKRLSPDTLEGIRALHASDPASYSTEVLSEHFKITPEAIRRILRSKWKPNDREAEDRRLRWEKRGAKKWEAMAEQGVRPPAKWRAMGIGRVERAPGKAAGPDDEYVKWDTGAGSGGGEEEEKVPRRSRTRDDGYVKWKGETGGRGSEADLYDDTLAERML